MRLLASSLERVHLENMVLWPGRIFQLEQHRIVPPIAPGYVFGPQMRQAVLLYRYI